jgi:hemin uptake protein HemP
MKSAVQPLKKKEHEIPFRELSRFASSDKRRCVSSEALFAGDRELLIEHAGEMYFLRHTSKGKLILTK